MQRTHWLLVEDNSAEAELAREAAASTGAIQLTIVRTGREALSYLRRQGEHADAPPAGLVLLDVNLPDLTGREVLAEIRSDPALRRIPVLIMSSSAEEREIAHFYESGANCYLVKPLHHADFEAMMRMVTQFWISVAELPPVIGGAP